MFLDVLIPPFSLVNIRPVTTEQAVIFVLLVVAMMLMTPLNWRCG